MTEVYGKTVDELLVLCDGGPNKEYDALHGPLSDPANAARVHRLAFGAVYLEGIADGAYKTGDYADDLLIVICEKGWAMFYRDAPGLPDGVGVLWGRLWNGGAVYQDWSSLVGAAYSL